MQNDMLISIITPVYNGEGTIRRTIESVLCQSYSNYEYIIIDGGSKDNTLSIIHEYLEKFDGKLRVYSEKDRGLYDAINKGIAKANGYIIGIVNSDDYYEPETLAKIVQNVTDDKYLVLYGGLRFLNNLEEEYVAFYNHNFLGKQMINHPTCFITKEVYNDFGMYDLTYSSAADYDFMLKLYCSKSVSFKPIYDVLSNFSLGGTSSKAKGDNEAASIRYKYGMIGKKELMMLRLRALLKRLVIG